MLMSESPHNSIKFLVISAIVAHETIEFLMKVGNRPLGVD